MSGEAFGLNRGELAHYDDAIVTGWPVSPEDLPPEDREIVKKTLAEANLPAVYYPGSSKERCAFCRLEIWLGPRSQAQRDRAPDRTQILCIICVTQLLAAGMNYTLHNLGNRGGVPRPDL